MNFQPLTEFLQQIPDKLSIPGLSCMVYHHHKPVYEMHIGHADAEGTIPPAADTLYNVYSISKIFTCTATLQLMEKGEFLLYDALHQYMPEFKDMYYKNPDGELVKVLWPITIENLFTMSAGFDYDVNGPAIVEAKEATQGLCPTVETIKHLAKYPLCYKPGTHWQYSFAHDILAGLIEVVSGQKFSEYMQEHIFDPLGMKDTGYHRTPEMEARMATQYWYDGAQKKSIVVPLDNQYKLGPEYESGGAGIISSLQDLMIFAEALGSGQVIGPRTLDLLKTNRLSPQMAKDFNWSHLTGYGYGLGVAFMSDLAAGSSIGSLGEFQWNGAAGSNILIDTQEEVSIAYTQHVLYSDVPYYHPKLRNVVYHCLGY